MEFNKEKFKTVLSYVINRCENKANVEKEFICKLSCSATIANIILITSGTI